MKQVRLAAQEGRNLQDVGDFCHGFGLIGLMNIRNNRNLQFFFDLLQHLQALFHPRAAEAVEGGTICFVKGSFENIVDVESLTDFLDGAANQQAAVHFLQHARASQQRQFLAAANFKISHFYLIHNRLSFIKNLHCLYFPTPIKAGAIFSQIITPFYDKSR